MEIVVSETPVDAALVVADAVERVLSSVGRPVLGLATGSSPLPVYRELIDRCAEGRISFAKARAFLLDEYVGLAPAHPEAYRSVIQRAFTNHIDLHPDALFGPDGTSQDIQAVSETYEKLIEDAGGIDLQLLGIGSDGHIGFNEPMSSLSSRTRLKTLTDATRADNARFFNGDVDAVPRHVITQGIGTILESRHVLLIATGASKSAQIASAVEGPLTAMVPASALQLHQRAAIVVDRAAAAQLTHTAYYREVYANKPDWQHL